MAITEKDGLAGKLVPIGIPKDLQWSTPANFVNALVEMLRVVFPFSPVLKLIVTGHRQPSPDDIDTVWARTDRNGNPLGWHGFFDGQWRQFHTAAAGEVRWFIGSSANPPEGWQFIDEDASGITLDIVTKLKTEYVEHPTEDGQYVYYAARYIGYVG